MIVYSCLYSILDFRINEFCFFVAKLSNQIKLNFSFAASFSEVDCWIYFLRFWRKKYWGNSQLVAAIDTNQSATVGGCTR